MTPAERDQLAATDRAMTARDIAELTAKVDKLSNDIEGMVQAWQNASFGVAVIKWLAAVIMAASGLWYVVTHFGKGH